MKPTIILFAAIALSMSPAVAAAAPADVASAVAAPGRTPDNVKLDEGRKPAEVLSFFGLRKGSQVIDMFGANQYWAEIMAPVVGPRGRVVVWQPTQFLNDDRRKKFAEFAKRHKNVSLISSPFEAPALGTNAYDFMIMNLDYHDVYWQNPERKIVRMEPDQWLKVLYAAMKPGATVGIIDHVALPNSDTRATVQKLHRIDPEVLKADFQRAGFELVGIRNFLRNPADDHSLIVFDPKIRGKTDRVVYRFREAALSDAKSSDSPEEAVAQPVKGRRAYWVLLALILGLGIGAMAASLGDGLREPALQASGLIGGLWLNALKMTVIPLVVALLVVGVARGAEAARAGRIAGRSVLWIVIVCTGSAIFGMAMIQLFTNLFPLPQAAAQALQAGLAGLDQEAAATQMPGIADFFRGIVPENVIAAASNGDVLPLVVFSLLFALAATRIGQQGRRSLVGLFEAIADTLLVIIGWVLWIAPLGVFALSFSVGASAGGAAFAGVLHYIILVSAIGVLVTLAGYPIAVLAGGIGLGSFTRSMIAPQSVAISTRSSLASLPAMLAAARLMGIREQVADVTLPIAVALFRGTGPAMNVAVAYYVAHWLGYEPSLGQVIAATAVAAVMSYAAISLPGEISFISSIAPIAMALGVPIAPLALLVAVEMIPDIIRTLGNVTLDVAVTSAVDRSTGGKQGEAATT